MMVFLTLLDWDSWMDGLYLPAYHTADAHDCLHTTRKYTTLHTVPAALCHTAPPQCTPLHTPAAATPHTTTTPTAPVPHRTAAAHAHHTACPYLRRATTTARYCVYTCPLLRPHTCHRHR